MAQKSAWEALTNPQPSEHQLFIVFVAQLCVRRYSENTVPNDLDISHLLTVLARWGYADSKNMRALSRTAYGRVVADIRETWEIIRQDKARLWQAKNPKRK